MYFANLLILVPFLGTLSNVVSAGEEKIVLPVRVEFYTDTSRDGKTPNTDKGGYVTEWFNFTQTEVDNHTPINFTTTVWTGKYHNETAHENDCMITPKKAKDKDDDYPVVFLFRESWPHLMGDNGSNGKSSNARFQCSKTGKKKSELNAIDSDNRLR